MTIVYIVLGIICLLALVAMMKDTDKKITETKQAMKKQGLDESTFIYMSKYVGGHPTINNEADNVIIYKKQNNLIIATRVLMTELPKTLGLIEYDKIKNIILEDTSTFEKRVSVGRVLLVGIFALAWKKNKKKEGAFVIIEWNDGRFDHETIFAFNGNNAIQSANTARNKLINAIR